VIRVSGVNSLKSLLILEKNDWQFKEKILNSDTIEKEDVLNKFHIKARYAYFRKFYELSSNEPKKISKIDIIDQGLIVYFPEGKSFTGEDIVEFHIHGSKAVQNKFMTELSKIKQFRLAEQVILK